MRNLNVFAAFLLMGLMVGCANADKIRPHQDPQNADVYCIYEITNVKGGGPRTAGDKICIYCPPPANKSCRANHSVEPAKGMVWDLKRISNTCTDCNLAATDRYEYANMENED